MTQVAAAVIEEGGKILICRRGAGESCAFLWEFPGGKLEPSETAQECVIRECREELGVDISVDGILAETTYRYPEREVALTFFKAQILHGEPVMRIHVDLCWVFPSELRNYEFCPANKALIRQLEMSDSGTK